MSTKSATKQSSADQPGRMSLTPDGRIRGCDDGAARLLRREPSGLPDVPLRQFVAPAYAALFDGFLQSVLTGRRPVGTTLGLRTPDGTVVPVLVDAVQSAAGANIDLTLAPLGMGLGVDGDAQTPRMYLRTVADALPALVAYWTRALRCEFANKAYIEWFGRAPEQIVGRDLRELLGEELFLMNEPYIRGALAGEAQGFERTLTKANGELGYTWAQYIPDVADGVVQGFFVLVSDISELKRAQQAARENEARFQAVIDASPVAHALVDQLGAITYVNPAFRSAFGYARDDIPTLERWWLAAIADPAERDAVVATWQARIAESADSGRPFEPLELRIRRKDGGERIVLARAAALGVVGAGGLIVLRDVTDERRLERQVLDTATREQHRFGVELHENLAQHLAAASMTLDVYCARKAPDSDRAAVTAAELAELAARLRACVETTRSMAYALSPVELGFGGLAGALKRLGMSMRTRRQLDVRVLLTGFEHGTLEPLVTEHVFRIAQEALANAVRHSRGSEFSIEATVAPDRLTLAVRDDGIGVPGATAANGPGLSIMRYRARALGGQLSVDSAPGGGTVVSLSCPLLKEGSLLRARDVGVSGRSEVTWH